MRVDVQANEWTQKVGKQGVGTAGVIFEPRNRAGDANSKAIHQNSFYLLVKDSPVMSGESKRKHALIH